MKWLHDIFGLPLKAVRVLFHLVKLRLTMECAIYNSTGRGIEEWESTFVHGG